MFFTSKYVLKAIAYLFVLFLLFFTKVFSQSNEWQVYYTINSALPNNTINILSLDSSGNVWIGTPNGHAIFSKGSLDSIPLNRLAGFPSVTAIATDKQNNIWIGADSGLSGSFGKLFKYNQQYLFIHDEFFTQYISFCFDSDNNLWGGCRRRNAMGDFIFKYDGFNFTIIGYAGIQMFFIDRDNNKWYGTAGTTANKIVKYDGIQWEIIRNYMPSIYAIGQNSKREIYVGTDSGITVFDRVKWTWNKFLQSNSGLPSNAVRCIFIDASDNLWVGTTGGLAYYDGKQWTTFTVGNSVLVNSNETFFFIV